MEASGAFLDAAISEAERTVTRRDRFHLVPALEEVEKYVAASREVFVSGVSAETYLANTLNRSERSEPDPSDYSLELHAPVPNRHARAIADSIQKRYGGGGESKTIEFANLVQVMTVVYDQILQISLGSRVVARVSLLPRVAGLRSADVIKPFMAKARWAKGVTVRCFNPDLVLSNIYGGMCDPGRVGDWALLAERERAIRRHTIDALWGKKGETPPRRRRGGDGGPAPRLGGGLAGGREALGRARDDREVWFLPSDPDERAAWGSVGPSDMGAITGGEERRSARRRDVVAPVVASRLLQLALASYASGAGRILVGEAAVDWKAAPRRLAFVAGGVLGEEEEALRRALAPGVSPQYTLEARVHEPHMPNDGRLRRLTLSVVSSESGARRPLVDVYNCAQYMLCPFFEAHHPGADQILKIGTLPLVMRVVVSEMWVITLLTRAGKLKEGAGSAALSDAVEALRVAGKKLDLRLVGKPGKKVGDPPERLPAYELVFPTEGRWYAGRAINEAQAAKAAAQKSREARRTGNYFPVRGRPKPRA
jgi:hypothetical protein